MRQVLYTIPVNWPFPGGIPIYGFGTMLVIALFLCTWLAGRRAQKEGIPRERVQDLALWVVICGIIGARVLYMLQDKNTRYDHPIIQFLQLWNGGLVFYGSVVGAVIGLTLAYYFVLRKHNLSWAKMADVIAPSCALGLSIGRLGCLLNGCCYGDVACPGCWSMGFPLSAPARTQLVDRGLQTAAGFTIDTAAFDYRTTVGRVEPGSAAQAAGLEDKDRIVAVDGMDNRVVVHVLNSTSRTPEDEFRALAERLEKHGHGAIRLNEVDGRIVGVKAYYSDIAGLQEDIKQERLNDSTKYDTRIYDVLWERLVLDWPRGDRDLQLTVQRHDNESNTDETIALKPFRPLTLGLHPTQLYETISTFLLFLLLTAFYPFKRLDGQVLGLFLTLYACHRFLNEMLRNDTDPVAFGLTLSQNGSVLVLLFGLFLLNRDRVMSALLPVRRVLMGS